MRFSFKVSGVWRIFYAFFIRDASLAFFSVTSRIGATEIENEKRFEIGSENFKQLHNRAVERMRILFDSRNCFFLRALKSDTYFLFSSSSRNFPTLHT